MDEASHAFDEPMFDRGNVILVEANGKKMRGQEIQSLNWIDLAKKREMAAYQAEKAQLLKQGVHDET